MKIKEIFTNIQTGSVYIKTFHNQKKRCLHQDEMGFFVKETGHKHHGMVERFLSSEDINRINQHLGSI